MDVDMKNSYFLRYINHVVTTGFLFAITGCGTAKLTVDDGRKLDDKLLSEMRLYGSAVKVLRPAIVKSAALKDVDCSKQHELPFDTLTTAGVKNDDFKVAWVRSLGVNENLTIIATDGSGMLSVGDVIVEVGGYKSIHTLKMVGELSDLRDNGKPFKLKLLSGKEVTITPLEVCRGHVTPAFPLVASVQEYHWTAVAHPQQIFSTALTPDEAAWIVLWTQGLSEVGGARMKGYAFAVGTVKWAAIVALGVASGGAMAAAGSAAAVGGASASAVAGQVLAISAASKIAAGLTSAAANRASLSGISGLAAGVFDKADKWAFDSARRLGVDHRAGLTLNDKLVEKGLAENAFSLDEDRLNKMRSLVGKLPPVPLPNMVEEPSTSATEVFRVSDPNSESVDASPGSVPEPVNAAIEVTPNEN